MTKKKYTDGTVGGYLVGRPHSKGGIKAVNKDTGEPLEVEGGEVVITKPAVQSNKTYEFEGKEMKPKEILSEINSDHGGVSFAKGGEVKKKRKTKADRLAEKYADVDDIFDAGGVINNSNDIIKDEEYFVLTGPRKCKFGKVLTTNNSNITYRKIYDGTIDEVVPKVIRYFIDNNISTPVRVQIEGLLKRKQLESIYNRVYAAADKASVYAYVVTNTGKYKNTGDACFDLVSGGLYYIVLGTDKDKVYEWSDNLSNYADKKYQEIYGGGSQPAPTPTAPQPPSVPTSGIQSENVPITAFKLFPNANLYAYIDYSNFNEFAKTALNWLKDHDIFRFQIKWEDGNVYDAEGYDSIEFTNVSQFKKPTTSMEVRLLINEHLIKRHWESKYLIPEPIQETVPVKQIAILYALIDLEPISSSQYSGTYSVSEFAEKILILMSKTRYEGDFSFGVFIEYVDGEQKWFTGSEDLVFSQTQGNIWPTTKNELIEIINSERIVEEKYKLPVISGQSSTTTEPEPEPEPEPQKDEFVMEDVRDTMLYEMLIEALETEEAQYTVMKSLVNHKTDPQKAIMIDRKLSEIYTLKAKYALEMKRGYDLLNDFAKAMQAEKTSDQPESRLPSVNGEPSELTEEQYGKVRTADFIDWFGDWILAYELSDYTNVSKIINPVTAEPRVLYHGSNADFTQWTFDQFPVAYFADNRSYSQWFADLRGDGGVMYEVFINMRNPINLQSFGLDDVPMGEILTYLADNYNLTDMYGMVPELRSFDDNELKEVLAVKMKIWQFVRRGVPFLNYVKENTFYDGILMYENNPQDIVNGEENTTGSHVVFYTHQIKWAQAVSFNAEVMDNRFARGGVVKSLIDKYKNLDLDF